MIEGHVPPVGIARLHRLFRDRPAQHALGLQGVDPAIADSHRVRYVEREHAGSHRPLEPALRVAPGKRQLEPLPKGCRVAIAVIAHEGCLGVPGGEELPLPRRLLLLLLGRNAPVQPVLLPLVEEEYPVGEIRDEHVGVVPHHLAISVAYPPREHQVVVSQQENSFTLSSALRHGGKPAVHSGYGHITMDRAAGKTILGHALAHDPVHGVAVGGVVVHDQDVFSIVDAGNVALEDTFQYQGEDFGSLVARYKDQQIAIPLRSGRV